MKLFGLPFVPLKEVLDNLDINSLFFLALCSKRTKTFIVQTQKYEFQKVDYFEYLTSGQRVVLRLNMISGEATTMIYLFDTTNDFPLVPFEFVRLKELGKPIDFLRCPDEPSICQNLQVIYNPRNTQVTIEVILKHLLDLIGHHTKFWVRGKFPNANLVPRIGNVKLGNMITVDDFKSSDMDEFLDRATSLEYLSWCAPLEWKYTPLRENSRLYELHTLYLWTESSVASDVMEHFNGRQAFLLGLISTWDAIQFLNAWKSGKKYRNLEVISMKSGEFDIPEIRNSVGLNEVSKKVEYSFVRNFPFVPLKEILDHLDLSPLLFLALCSKRTKTFIVQTQKYEFKKIDYVEYWTCGEQVAFKLNMVSGEVDTLMYLFDTTNDFTMDPFEFVRLNELGTPIDFLRCPTDPTMCQNLQGIYIPGAQEIIEVILKHLLDLIGHHTKFRVMGIFPDSNVVPMFRNIQMSHMVTGDDFESKDMDEFLDRANCPEYLLWCTSRDWKYTPPSENSRLYELDTLHLFTDTCSVISDVVKRFNGRHAFLFGDITTTHAVQFLNSWKSGEKFRNLEVINMGKMDTGFFEIPEIGSSVALKEVNSEVKYSFVRKYPDHLPCPTFRYSWELISRFYMVRESDGHVASVWLTPTRIFMGVWNMTEMEFLEKFHDSKNFPLL